MSAPPRSCSGRRSLCPLVRGIPTATPPGSPTAGEGAGAYHGRCRAGARGRSRPGDGHPQTETRGRWAGGTGVGADGGDGRSTAGRPRQVRYGPERRAWNMRKLQGSSIFRARRQRRLCGESDFRFRMASVPCTSTTVTLTGTVVSFKILSVCGQ